MCMLRCLATGTPNNMFSIISLYQISVFMSIPITPHLNYLENSVIAGTAKNHRVEVLAIIICEGMTIRLFIVIPVVFLYKNWKK